MSKSTTKDRFFRIKNVLVCKKTAQDGRLAMLALDSVNCQFVIEPYYFNIFFHNTDWIIEELNEIEFKKAVIEQCGYFPDLSF